MLEQIKQRLGANYIEDTENIIQDIIADMTSIACDASNRKETDNKLFPYIKKAVISEYNARGSEAERFLQTCPGFFHFYFAVFLSECLFIRYHRTPVMHTEEYPPAITPTISGRENSLIVATPRM